VSDVATPPSGGEAAEVSVDEALAHDLVERARSEGVELVGPGGLLTGLTKTVLETALEVELEEHLGYPKHAVEGNNSGNSRNDSRKKGPVEIEVREGSFDPKIVKKRQRRLVGVDEMVISLAAKGLTTAEISAHLADVRRVRRQVGRHLPGDHPAVGKRLGRVRAVPCLQRRDPRCDLFDG